MGYFVRKANGVNPDTYHTDRDCFKLPDGYRELSQNELDKTRLQECKFCSGEVSWKTADEQRTSLRELIKDGNY
jgi:hypothetical protein